MKSGELESKASFLQSAAEKFKNTLRHVYREPGFEPFIWIGAFIFLAIHNPYTQTDFTFCPFKNLGFNYCPGCGLGRSVSFLLHGDLIRSFRTHVLGIPATIILTFRTFSLLGISIRSTNIFQRFSKLRRIYG